MKNSTKISVLISLVLISLLALGAVSAADDTAVADDANLAAVDDVQTVDDAPTTDEINYESNDIVVTDTGDSGDLDDADTDVISDTGLKNDSDNGDEAVVSDASSPKSVLKAEIEPEEPLGAPDGTFADLQTRINNAQAGSTITLDRNYVYNAATDGNYRTGITINKRITIDGAGFTIDGRNTARLFNFNNYVITLKNLNLINGRAQSSGGYNPNYLGGAIYSNSAGTYTIENCNFTNNKADSTSNNRYRGGAIYSTTHTSLTIINSTFTNNSAYQGGVIYGPTTNITGSTFVNNTAVTGGVIQANSGTFTINNSSFDNNRATNGGVLYSTNTALTVNINDSNFTKNSATTSGGVIYTSGTTTIKSSVLVNNSAGTYGGVVYNGATGARLTMNYNVIMDNAATRGHTASYQSANNIESIDYNWWGQNVLTDRGNIQSETEATYMSPSNHYILKLRQLSATVIEVSLNSLDIGTLPADAKLPAREYFMTITPDEAFIRTPTGNFTGAAVSNFTVPGNGTITAKVDYETIVLDIYQNTRGTIDLNITVADVVLPNKAVAIVEASFDDVYNVTVGEKTYQVTVTGGTGQVELDELPEGTYLAMLSHTDNDEYHDAYNLTTFHVTKAQSAISLDANTTTPTFGTDVKVTPTVTSADGTVTITNGTIIYTVDGKNYAALEAGEDLIVTGLSAGDHRIVAKYGGNEQYQGSTSLELLINVQKATLTLSIVGAEVVYPEPGKITLNSNVDGVYTIYVGEDDYEVRVSLGSGTVAIPTLPVGNYTVTVNVAESENYTAASATGTYNVTKAIPKFTIDGDDRITYGQTNEIVPTLTEGATGDIVYYIDTAETGTSEAYPNAFTTTVLDAGSHTIRAEYAGDSNFAAKNATFTFTVVPAEVDVTVTGATVVYPIHANVTVTASAAGTYTITVNGKEYDVEIDEDGGSKLVNLDEIPVGVHYVAVNASAVGNYKEVSIDKAATVVVNKPTLNLTVSNVNITYGETANVSITLKDGDTGLSMQNLIVSVGDTYYPVNIVNGVGNLPITGLNSGKYNVIAVCSYSENYDIAIANGTITVNKATPTLTVTANPITYGQDATITFGLEGVDGEKLNGVLNVIINGESYDVIVNNGVGTLTVSGLNANEYGYPITASFPGNDNYAGVYGPAAKQVVLRAIATVELTPVEVPYGQDAVVNVSVTGVNGEKLNGTVNLHTEGGSFQDVTITDGVGTFTASGLDVGTYSVSGVLYEQANYVSDNINVPAVITVIKANTTITLYINPNPITYGQRETNIYAEIAGIEEDTPVIYYVGEDVYDEYDTKGFQFDNMDAGNYTVYVKFNGNDQYNPCESEREILVVNKANPTVTVSSDKNEIEYGDIATLESVVSPIDATGDVIYYVNGTALPDNTMSGFGIGEYTVVAEYQGDKNYNAFNSTPITITVTKATPKLTVTTSDIEYGRNATISIGLTGLISNYPIDGIVKVTIDNEDYDVVVSDGVGTLTVSGLNANEAGYVINAYFEGNENYTSATNATTKQVVRKTTPHVEFVPVEVPYGHDANVTITVTGVNDEKLNGTVVVYIDSDRDGEVTITDGVGTYTARGLDMGPHGFAAQFTGNDNYGTNTASLSDGITVIKANVTITIKANGTDVTYGTSVYIWAEMEGIYDYVTYYIDGVEVSGSTVGHLIETPNAGDHSVYVKYDGNNKYNPCQSEVLIITVNKADPTVTLSADATTIRYGETVVLSSDVSPSNATGDVIYYVDGEAKESNIVSGLAIGEHTVVAEYQGNDNYNAAESNTVTITVTKAIPDITVTSDPVSYPNDAVVNIALTGVNGAALPGTTVRVTFNGTTYAVVTDDEGKASLTLKGLTVGVYPIEAVSVETDLYESATNNTANVVVEKGNLTVIANASARTPYVGDEVVFSYTIVAPEGAVTDGTVTYIVDGAAIDGDRLSNLALGEHNVVVRYTGDSNFNDSESLPYEFEVIKQIINVSIECDPVVYPNKGTIILHVNNAENYTVRVGGKEYPVEITEDGGSATITVDKLDAGTYNVTVEYEEHGIRTGRTFYDAYEVLPAETEFTISPKDGETVYSGDLANVTVSLPEGATGNITYYVDGVEKATIDVANEFGIAGLGVGEHTVTAKYNGDKNHLANESTTTITVNKIPLTINIEGDTVTYPDDARILIDVYGPNGVGVDGITVLVTVNDVTYVVETGGSDLGTPLIIKGLDAGQYPITAVSIGDDKYEAANYTGNAKVVVNRATPTLTVTTSPIAYGEVATITFGLDGVNGEKLDGIVKVTIDSKDYEVTVSEGVGTLTVRGLDVNEVGYVINALFEGNDNYGSVANATTKQVVNKADTTITVIVEPNTITYGQEHAVYISAVIADIEDPVDVIYYIGDKVEDFYNTDGMLYPIDWDAGTYPVYVRFEGNDQYNPCESEHVTLTINKANPIVELTAEDYEIEFGNIAILYGKVIPEDATGGIVYYVNGSALPGNTMQGFGVGEYTVVAEYQGNRNYNKVRSDAITITVTKATPKLTVTTSDIVYGRNATINIGLKGLYDPIDGIVKVTIDSKEYEVTVSEGVGTLTVSGLNANEAGHVINAYFAENENYTSVTNATTKQVVHKATAHVDSVPVVVPYGQDATVNITLTGVNDEKLNGTVEVWYDNVMGVPITITDGVGTFTASDLDMGNHTVIAHFIGNDNYNEITSSRSDGITVIKANTTITINANATNITYGDFVGVWAEIADIDDVVTVTYYVNGEAIEGNTDGKTLSAYDAGNITVYVRFEGNDKYNACESENLTITINKADSTVTVMPNVTTIKYGETVELDAIVIPDDPNADITYFVDEYKVEGTTVSGLGVGNHTVVAYYQGNKNYNEAWSERVTITVNKAIPVITVTSDPVTYPNDAVVNIALTAVNGTAIPRTTVRVTVNGTTYAVVTDDEGKASLTLKGLNVGEYPIEAVSVETDLYESATNNTAKVVVEIGSLLITADVSNHYPYVGDEVVFTYTLSATQGGLTTGTVTYYVDGEAIDGDRLSNLTAGVHRVVAKYTNDPNFNDAESLPVTINVLKHAVVVSIECDPVVYPNGGTITLTASEAGNYTVTVADQSYDVEITEDGGSAPVSIAKLNVGNYTVDVSGYGAVHEIFADAYEVLPGNITYVLEAPTVTYPSEATLHYGFSAPGEYIITINGTEKSIVVADTQEYDVNIGVFDVGVYDIGLRANIDNYNPIDIANATTLTVLRTEIEFTISPKEDETPVYGGLANVTVNLPEDATGTITYYVDGVEKGTIDVADVFSITGLSVGDHNVYATYSGNNNYAPAQSNTITITVGKATPALSVTVADDNITFGEDATINIGLTGLNNEKLNGIVKVTIALKDYYVEVSNGVGTLTVSGLDVYEDGHVINAYFVGNDNYTNVSNATTKLIVDRDRVTVEYVPVVVPYGQDATVTITVTGENSGKVNGSAVVWIDHVEDREILITDGVGTYTASGLDAGPHHLEVYFLPGDKYYPRGHSEDNGITVIKANATITISLDKDEIVYGETIELSSVINPEDATGDVTYFVDGNAIEGNTVSGLDVGKHTVVAEYQGNDNYNAAESNTVTITVTKAIPVITVTSDPVSYPNDAVVNIALTGVNGAALPGTTVRVTFNGTTYALVTDDEGKASLALNGLIVGEYPVEVVSVETDLYESATNTANVVVEKGNLTVIANASAKYPYVGDEVVFSYTVVAPEGAVTDGTVTYIVDGEAIDGDRLSNLALGEHNVVVNYTGDSNFNDTVSLPYVFEVIKHANNVSIECDPVVYPNEGTIILHANNADNYTVTVGGKEYPVEITEDGGSATITVDTLDVGTYNVIVEYYQGAIHTGQWFYDAYEVLPAETVFTISPKDGETVYYGDLANVTVNLPEGANGTITYYVDGKEVATIEMADVFAIADLGVGDHNVYATYSGQGNYGPAQSNMITITVNKATPVVTVNGTTVKYGDPATVKVAVTDADGHPVTGTVIVVASWSADGETKIAELEIDGTGEATFILDGAAPGTVDVNATFIANDKYATAYNDTEKIYITDSTDLTLEVTANEATLGEDTILNVVATDGSGAGVDIDKVNVTVNGVTEEYDVDQDGNVNIGKLPVGTTEVTVSYADEFYGEVQDTVNVTVNKATADLNVVPGEGSITIEVKDNKGEPISGYAAVVVDGGAPDDVWIGENGTAEYNITASPGPHTVEVTFTNDKYEPVTKTVTVIVPKHTTELSISTQDTPTYGDDVTIKANITEKATGTITYYVDGSTVGTEIAIGENFVVSGLSAGEHTIRAKYAGDDLYGPADSNVLTINVAKADLVIIIDSATTYYPNKGTVEVSANNDGVYTINVNGKPYTVTIVAGKGTFEVTEVLPVAEYPITWDIAESENYTGDSGSAVYKVLNTAPDFSITGTSEIDYGNKNTIIPTINEDATGTITYSINGAEVATLGVKENFVTDVLDAGHYTVTAKYSGDTNYGEMTKTFEFDVLPIDVVVSVTSDEVYYPNTGSISLNASAPGTYTVLVGNKTYTAVVTEAGVPVVVEVESLEVGKYEINVTAPASTNYKAVDTGAIGTYVVSKAKSTIEVTYNKETGIATVTLEGADDHVKLNETISFELDGELFPDVATTDGRYESEDLKLAPGKHSIFVVFVGNENYLGSYDQEAFEVDKFNTAEVTVSADPIKEGEDAIIKITVKDGETGLSGVVTVTLDGTDYAVDVTDGEGTLTVKNMVATESPKTTYPITAKFNGNDDYAEATGEGSIEVTDWNDVIIAISGSEEGAVVSLVDTDLNNITGEVMVSVDGADPKPYPVENGKALIDDIEPGNHTIAVVFEGDETHPPADKTETVYIGKVLIPVDMTITLANIKYTEVANAVVILKDTAGNLLSGTVTLTIGDQVKQVTVTNGRGEAKFSGLNANSYVAVGEFASDGTYAAATATAPLVVSQLKTRIIARNMTTTAINVTEDGRIGQYFTWTLVDEKGRPLEGKAMSIGFNANVYNRVTNASGQAKLQINLQNSGPYTFAISFLGDENYEGSFEVVKIDVNKQKATLTASGATYKASASTKTLSATYKTKAGKPIVGKTVKFTVNGKTYSAKTDSKGVAKVNVSLTKAGSYSVKVTAPATNTYAETTKTVTLKLT